MKDNTRRNQGTSHNSQQAKENRTMKTIKTLVLTILALTTILGFASTASAAPSTASATPLSIIYYDDFSGSTSTTLKGTAPDIRPGSQTWGGYSSPSSNTVVTAGGTFGNKDGNVLLPFTPQSGNKYELSAVITTNTTQPVYFGFQQRDWSGPLWEVQDIVYAQVSSASALLKDRDGSTNSTLGTGSFSSGGTVSIVLDATDASSANWTLDLFVNGSAVVTDQSTTLANLGNMRYVSIHGSDSGVSGVSIDDFTLAIIPEPASLSLMGLALAGLTLRRRRK